MGILIIEQDSQIIKRLSIIKDEYSDITIVPSWDVALGYLSTRIYDLVLMNISLIEVGDVREIRRKGINRRVMLFGYSYDEMDVNSLFMIGFDECVRLDRVADVEILARSKRLMSYRRILESDDDVVYISQAISYFKSRGILSVNGIQVELTPKERSLVEVLGLAEVVSLEVIRRELAEVGGTVLPSLRAVVMLIKRLKDKVYAQSGYVFIRNSRGKGYYIVR